MPLPIVNSALSGDAGAVGRDLMATVLTAAKSMSSISSLADVTKPLRVEPITIIDQTIADQPYIQDLLKLSVSLYAGYYLQAVNMVFGVGKIDTLKVFDSLNPERSGASALGFENFRSAVFSPETYANGIPSLEAFAKPMRQGLIAEYSDEKYQASLEYHTSMEAQAPAAPGKKDVRDQKGDKEPVHSMSSGDGGKIYEAENLAIGKLINVEVKSGNEKAKLPVTIKLIPAVVPSDTITHIFTAGGRDTWAHRLFLVKSGQIKFWRDFVMGQDMIDAHMKALMTDKSGVYKTILDRRRNNVAQAIASGRLSLADASNIAIISATTMKQSANTLYAKIDDVSVRKKFFDNSYLLMMMTVDERWNRVTIYHRGVDLAASYRIDDIKLAEKSKGQDITEIFKMFSKQMHTNI
jgi:hypothetical protein